jgi:hypothetical protein
VVVSGNLPSADGKYSLYCAVIVKRVDAQTRAKTSAERTAARLTRSLIRGTPMATTTAPGTMERILRLMSDKKASDVYLSAHSPALIKINGQCIPINNQVLPPDAHQATCWPRSCRPSAWPSWSAPAS